MAATTEKTKLYGLICLECPRVLNDPPDGFDGTINFKCSGCGFHGRLDWLPDDGWHIKTMWEVSPGEQVVGFPAL